MTGDDQRERILSAGLTDGAAGEGTADLLRKFLVSKRVSPRDLAHSLPDLLGEGRAIRLTPKLGKLREHPRKVGRREVFRDFMRQRHFVQGAVRIHAHADAQRTALQLALR